MLTMLLMRPATVAFMLYFSGAPTRSALRNGESGAYRGMTMPPGRMGCGGASRRLSRPTAVHSFGPPGARYEKGMPIQFTCFHHLQTVFAALQLSRGLVACAECEFATRLLGLFDECLI